MIAGAAPDALMMLAAMARAASVTGVAEVEGTGRFCGRGASVSDSDAMVAEGARARRQDE